MNNETLDNHIHAIYETVGTPSLWKNTLSDISATINAKAGMIGSDNVKTKTHLASIRSGFTQDALDALAPYHSKCLWTHALIALNPSRFVTSEQILPLKEYLASELFDGFGRYFDSHHAIGLYFDKAGESAFRMSFLRSKSQGPYSQYEATYLNLLLPHIKQALNLSRKLVDNNLLTQFSNNAIASHNNAVFVIDGFCQIIKVNKFAEEQLCKENWLQVVQNRLVIKKGLCNSKFQALVASVTRSDNFVNMKTNIPFIIEFDSSSTKDSWLMEISRLDINIDSDYAHIFNFPNQAFALITVKKLTQLSHYSPQRLKSFYNLSKTEIDIAIKLANGDSPLKISEDRCRSLDTIRTQIKHLNEKLGLKNTNQIISRITQLTK
jgi:DNA-binding CsgD family transcriptional regulator